MVVEYKPSHKLSVFNLRAGLLRADSGCMNVPEDIINRITTPTDPEERLVVQLRVAGRGSSYSKVRLHDRERPRI